MRSTNTKGNVLFLILIAVALFAALSYAVTQSNKGGGNGITKDKIKITASQVVQYSTEMEQAISRMLLINKVQDYAFDFSASGYSASGVNGTCTSDLCRVFHSNGGTIPAQLLPKAAWDMGNVSMTGSWQGKMWFRVLRVQDVGSPLPDLVLLYPGLSEEVCAQINKNLDIANLPSGSPPVDNDGSFLDHTGTLTAFPAPAGMGLGDSASQIIGKRTFCVGNGGSNYYFYHVIMAR